MKLMHYLLAAVTLVVPVAGCGSDNKSGSSNNNSSDNDSNQTPSSAEADISAANGGELTLGDASVSIPAGALAADTKVTVESKEPSSSMPDQASLQGLVYDFGPNGTTFSKPVALTLPLTATPGEGKEAVISWLDTSTNAWVDLTTTVENGKAKADVQHFTQFIIRLKGVSSLDCSFQACGGDVVGTWQIQGGCFDVGSEDNPFATDCPSATFDVAVDATGTIEFTADGNYTTTFGGTDNVTVVLPAACIQTLYQGAITACDQVDLLGGGGDGGGAPSCTGDIATSCTCTKSEAIDPKPSTGTYTKTTDNVIILQDSDETADTAEHDQYCVSDNNKTLKVSVQNSDSVNGIFVAKKN